MRSSRPASTRSPPALDPDGVSVLPARSLLALPRLCVTSTRGEGRVDPHLAAQSTVETGPRRGPAPGPRRGADDVARAALLLPACGGPSRACRGPHEVARRGALRSRAWTRDVFDVLLDGLRGPPSPCIRCAGGVRFPSSPSNRALSIPEALSVIGQGWQVRWPAGRSKSTATLHPVKP